MKPLQIGQELLDQDDRCTSEPMFQVLNHRHREGDGNVEAYVKEVFLTQRGADEYILTHGHNLNNPLVYIESGWNNKEWIAIRKLFISIAEGTLKLSDLD